jgi:F-type H+-transporting ATPase subunit b
MINIDESFVVAICFFIFLFLSFRPIKRAIVNSLDARIKEIKEVMHNTQKVRDDAKVLLEQCKMELDHFEERKNEMINSAETSTENLVKARSKEIDLQIRRMSDSAIKSIDSMKNNATKDLQKEFTDHVMNLVRTYLKESGNNQTSNEEVLKLFLKK